MEDVLEFTNDMREHLQQRERIDVEEQRAGKREKERKEEEDKEACLKNRQPIPTNNIHWWLVLMIVAKRFR